MLDAPCKIFRSSRNVLDSKRSSRNRKSQGSKANRTLDTAKYMSARNTTPRDLLDGRLPRRMVFLAVLKPSAVFLDLREIHSLSHSSFRSELHQKPHSMKFSLVPLVSTRVRILSRYVSYFESRQFSSECTQSVMRSVFRSERLHTRRY